MKVKGVFLKDDLNYCVNLIHKEIQKFTQYFILPVI
jgi:hypothetical protein